MRVEEAPQDPCMGTGIIQSQRMLSCCVTRETHNPLVESTKAPFKKTEGCTVEEIACAQEARKKEHRIDSGMAVRRSMRTLLSEFITMKRYGWMQGITRMMQKFQSVLLHNACVQ